MTKNTIDILNANKSDSSFVWQKESAEHCVNWSWVKYSTLIALKVRKRMKELNLTQMALAERIGCTQQYVSLLLKGRENLTLETISKLESSLNIQLFSIHATAVNGYGAYDQKVQYLSDAEKLTR